MPRRPAQARPGRAEERPASTSCYASGVDADTRHFAVIAKVLAADADDRIREALAIDPVERMRIGLRLAETTLSSSDERELDERARGQAELHAASRRRSAP